VPFLTYSTSSTGVPLKSEFGAIQDLWKCHCSIHDFAIISKSLFWTITRVILTLKYIVTLKSRLSITRGHWKWHDASYYIGVPQSLSYINRYRQKARYRSKVVIKPPLATASVVLGLSMCLSVCPFVCLIIIIIRQLIRRRNMSIKSLLHRASGTTCLPTSFLHRHWLFSSGAWRLICLDNHSADNWFCYLSLKLCLRQDNYCRLILILILIIIIQGPKCVHKNAIFSKTRPKQFRAMDSIDYL